MTTPELDSLTTEELREKAFAKAQHAHDLGFFWDLVKHLRASREFAGDDGSGGGLTGGITDAVAAFRELGGRDLGDDEPLLRAKFLDYLAH